MAQDLEKLVVSLEANLKQYERELARAQSLTVTKLRAIESQAQKSASALEGAFGRLGGKLKAGLLAALTIGGLTEAINGIRGLVGEIAKLGDIADRTGVSTDFLQALQIAAVEADLSLDDLNSQLLKFTKNVGLAKNGSGDLLKIFRANNKEISGNVQQDLATFANLVQGAATEAEKLALVYMALGKGSDAWVEILSKGNQGLQGFQAELDRTGGKLDAATIKRFQVIDDKWAALMLSMERHAKSMVISVTEIFDKMPVPPILGKASGAVGAAQLEQRGKVPSLFPGLGAGFAGTPVSSNVIAGSTNVPNPEEEAAAKKAREETARAAEAEAKAIAKVIEQLQYEIGQLHANELQQRINTALKHADVSATSEQGKKIADLVTQLVAQEQAQERAAINAKHLVDAQQAAAELIAQQMKQLQDAFKDAFLELVEGARDGKLGLQDLIGVLDNLSAKLLQMAADKAFQFLLNALVGAALPGSTAPSTIGLVKGMAGRQGGGHVNAGQPYMVGEHGPEPFIPSQSGQILPASTMGQGSQAPIINIINQPGVASSQSSSSRGGRDVIDIVNKVVEGRFPQLLNRNSGLIGAKPASRRTV